MAAEEVEAILKSILVIFNTGKQFEHRDNTGNKALAWQPWITLSVSS